MDCFRSDPISAIEPGNSSRLRPLFIVPGIFALAIAVYMPALENGFLHWDDYTYVYHNPYIQPLSIATVRWALTTTYFSYWHPLTWISHLLDYTLWGMDPYMHHLGNVLLHGLNCIAVFFLALLVPGIGRARQAGHERPLELRAMLDQPASVGGATIAALLFAVHPQHVEVVAWVCERKELLSTLFYLLAVCVYLIYGLRQYPRQQRALFMGTFVLFLFCVMSKPMSVTLPVVLLLLDIYPLRRFTGAGGRVGILLEKLPLLAISAGIIAITILSQTDAGAIQSLDQIDLWGRCANAFNNSVFYLSKWLVPIDLVPYYPFPAYVRQFSWQTLIPIVIFFAITTGCLLAAGRKKAVWPVLWLVYLVILSPVIGLIQSGPQAAADRYAYLPTVGLYILVAGIVGRVVSTDPAASRLGSTCRSSAAVALLAAFFMLTTATHRQIAIWRDDLTLWSSVVRHFPDASSFPYNNLGNAYFERGDYATALRQYLKTLEFNPNDRGAYDNILAVVLRRNETATAFELLNELTLRYPRAGLSWQTLGRLQTHYGLHAQAIESYRRALSVEPNLPVVYYGLGRIHIAQRDGGRAAQDLARALELAPDYVDAMMALAGLYRGTAKPQEAVRLYAKAIAVAPEFSNAYYALGALLVELGRPETATDVYERLLRIAPRDPLIYLALSRIHLERNDFAAAETVLIRAVALNPDSAVLHRHLGEFYAARNRRKLARRHLNRARELSAAAQGMSSGELSPPGRIPPTAH